MCGRPASAMIDRVPRFCEDLRKSSFAPWPRDDDPRPTSVSGQSAAVGTLLLAASEQVEVLLCATDRAQRQ
jgi:hypothetical protein